MPDPTWPDPATLTPITGDDVEELDEWWRFVVLVAPRKGSGAYGNTYSAVFAVRAWVRNSTTLVRDTSGAQVTSTTTILAPTACPSIPVGSLVKLPPEFDGRVAEVITFGRNLGGGQPVPEHVKAALT